ncbi:SRSF protein kinase 3-like [Xenia sp. Carnegie-2017]|uniref:SRSF protein kinase 3-like n=1 Tax=Xenia sp. Carnegie-2017 TaxID=2897299 RepID=UPI001F03C8D1|nr:SRSF protein kinase 3-like [Xenia sp. Carnegie-2017]
MNPNMNRKVLAIQAKKRRGKATKNKQVMKRDAGKVDKKANRVDNPPPKYESDNDDDNSDSEEQEDVGDYKRGGYHPVKLGDLFNNRYSIIRKLGWGHFSTVWLAWDLRNKCYAALKIVKSASHYTETALDEKKLLDKVHRTDPTHAGHRHVVQMLDDFKITGVHGTHICMVFEVLGHNLLKSIIQSNYTGLPIRQVKSIIKQTLLGLDYLHSKCGIIHTDIKPENILYCINNKEIQKLAYDAKMASLNGNLSSDIVATAPQHIILEQQKSVEKLTKNQKKKLKKRLKKQQQKYQLEQDKLDKTIDEEAATRSRSSNDDTELGNERNNVSNAECAFEIKPTVNNNEQTSEDGNVNGICDKENENIVTTKTDAEISTQITCGGNERVVAEAKAANVDDEQMQWSNGESVNNEKERKFCEEQLMETSSSKVCCGDVGVNETMENVEKLDVSEGDGNESEVMDTVINAENDVKSVKIADLGNACWVDHHFTDEIQTRQYRSIEVLVGSSYGPPADIWSTACMAFELLTGDYLFEPHSGDSYSRDEDHIAHIMELLGKIPKNIALGGKYSCDMFNRKGILRNITELRPWPLESVLVEKYEWNEKDAGQLASFLLPMLDYVQNNRATAAECLQHPWLSDA